MIRISILKIAERREFYETKYNGDIVFCSRTG